MITSLFDPPEITVKIIAIDFGRHGSSVMNFKSVDQLSAQKQVAPYAKFACLDGCHLTGKFKEMYICATNQHSNRTIFILAHGLVPREDE